MTAWDEKLNGTLNTVSEIPQFSAYITSKRISLGQKLPNLIVRALNFLTILKMSEVTDCTF